MSFGDKLASNHRFALSNRPFCLNFCIKLSTDWSKYLNGEDEDMPNAVIWRFGHLRRRLAINRLFMGLDEVGPRQFLGIVSGSRRTKLLIGYFPLNPMDIFHYPLNPPSARGYAHANGYGNGETMGL
jgi:hypothetical protein